MAEDFVELGGEAINHIVDRHWDRIYDKSSHGIQKARGSLGGDKAPSVAVGIGGENVVPVVPAPAQSAVSQSSRRKHRNNLPSPEGSIEQWERQSTRESNRRSNQRDPLDEQQSETSERVIRSYESERDDPRRKPESVLSRRDLNKLRHDSRMSYANGYGNQSQRPQSAGPRTRYYDDGDDSDYDEKSGRRYRASGRGYEDDDYEDDRGYDREVVTTERYRGPARDIDAARGSRGNDGYGAGAVTQYQRRSTQDYSYDDQQVSKPSRSRSQRDKDRGRDRDYDDSRSRSRSRSGSRDRGFGGKVGEHFDTSLQGLGAGVVGAVVGGMVGRNVSGRGSRHQNRDVLLGAIIGGLGANVAENKWRDYMDEKKDKVREDEERFEQRYDGRDYGRSRSAMR